MSNYKIRPINTGFIPTFPLQYHYHFSCAPYLKNVSSEKVALPCFAFLIEGGEKTILVDTGMADTQRANEYHHKGSWQDEGQDIISQLKKIGYQPEDIDIVVFTHLHWDHVYHMNEFTNAKFYVHKKEYEFAMNPIPLYYKSYEAPVLGITAPFTGIEFTLVEGETEIIPGVRTFESFGHSPGHQCVEIDTSDGKYVCVGDAMFVMGNLDEIPELHYNVCPPGRFYNIVEEWHTIETIKSRVPDRSKLLLCHDVNLVDRIKKTPILG